MQEDPSQALAELGRRIAVCTDCPLSRGRTRAVPGEGPPQPDIMFIGEGPGFHEDQQGRPFVGPAGKLLEELLASVGIKRGQVYITNVVKCRPPENREPLPGEIQACRKYLDRQIELLRPKVIVTLGRFSLAYFSPKDTISKAHGRPREWNGTIVFPMYHPAAALHNQGMAKYIREDMKQLPGLVQKARTAQQGLTEGQEQAQPKQLSMF